MTKENIQLFSEMHAEPSWLADLRQKAFDKIETLELPVIERVKFHRWNLGDGTITESEPSANVPDFTALDNHLKLVQVGTQTVFEQIPVCCLYRLPFSFRRNSRTRRRILHVICQV